MVKRWLGKLARARDRARGAASSPPAYVTSMPEITPYSPTPAQGSSPRLNIILPSINGAHYFGGIHTAVLLYQELCRHFPRSRVILSDAAPEQGALARLPGHVLGQAHAPATAAREVVAYSDRYQKQLCVEPGDFWLCTGWWTAYAAQRLQSWQASELGSQVDLLYLVQDFEPGFYPWSSNYCAALSTYRPDRDLAIFNTGLLADYFAGQGLAFERKVVFEPTLNPGLRKTLQDVAAAPVPRERRIVIYGRPSTPRNAFELICEALRLWRAQYPGASSWKVVSPGEIKHDLDIGGLTIHGLGKLAIDEYGELLATSSVGLSLMVSPHPSYPPLEMAAFGMRVVTNTYANKDLSRLSANLRSAQPTPEDIARQLGLACAEAEAGGMLPLPALQGQSGFLDDQTFGDLASSIAAQVRAAGTTL